MPSPENLHYSVLMSVYVKEKAAFLRQAMDSMWAQTVPTDDFVLVCDGPLTDELNAVIEAMEKQHDALHVVRLEKNSGLGNALNAGLAHCRNDLIARMDSDDISLPDRCEKLLAVFSRYPETDIASGTIEEFEESPDQVNGVRKLPLDPESIVQYSRRRTPFNHAATMLRKEAVQAAGGYSEKYHLFEDYYLWARMLMRGSQGRNIPDTVMKVRAPADMYIRRGGKAYTQDMLRFFRWMLQCGWVTKKDFLLSALPRALVYRMPNGMRKLIYKFLHR